MNNDNILSEIDDMYNEINPIRKMFSKEELSAFDNFVNSQHPQIYEPESLSEKCYLLFRHASCTNDFKPKSVIRISLCRTAKRNPLIFPI